MEQTPKPQGVDLSPSAQLQRNHSLSGDRTPSISGSSLLSPPSVSPDPAYIAASAASQIVNSDRADRGQDWLDGGHQGIEVGTATVASGSLLLINAFLDHLLFSFLASSRSTSIASLRPAILDVLKPRLGKEAIDGADEELQGYLAGGDAEELLAFHSGQEFKGEYNLNLIWRRTRLRCMVYTRLGDMEEEDEEMYLKQEHDADANDRRPRLSRDLGSVSPAAAIFLTSILEFLGEHALLVAGEAARNRMQSRQAPADSPSAMVIEECDMEKLAFNTTLGRLWRSWRKRARTSSFLSPKPMYREMQRHKSGSLSASDSAGRENSINEDNETGYFDSAGGPSDTRIPCQDQGRTKVTRKKTNELPEEPDFSDFSAEDHPLEVGASNQGRPRSMIEYQRTTHQTPAQAQTCSQAASSLGSTDEQARPTQHRQRSSSMPSKQTPYISRINEAFATPSEGRDPFIRNGDQVMAEKEMPRSTHDVRTVPEPAGHDPGVSTIYDGVIAHGTEPLPETIAERNDRGNSTYTVCSNYTDEYDHEMAPQALKLHKPVETNFAEPELSPVSPLSSNGTFDLAEVASVGHPEESAQKPAPKVNREASVPLSRGYPINQAGARIESDRQQEGNLANLATLQGHQLRTYDESGKAVKRDIPVLYDTPSSEIIVYNHQAPIYTDTGSRDKGEVIVPSPGDRPSGPGVPPLTPLRELKDAAHDTSEEASSITPSNNATSKSDVFVPTHRHRGSDGPRHSSFSSSLNHTQPASAASRLADLRSQPLAVYTGTERAAVQRVSPSPATPLSANGRTSTSSNRPMTACSTHSQRSSKIKGIIGRESGDLSRQPMPKRTSSDGSGSLIKTPNKEQDFEQLIKSDETVKYTLTPQNMRDMESPESPRWQTHSRSETAELADFLRNSTPTAAEADGASTSRSSTKLRGLSLRSNPTNSTSPTAPTHGPTPSVDTVSSQPKPIPRLPNPRAPGVVPRDPTRTGDSLRDFADFIRSTGPDTPAKALPKPVLQSAKTSRPTSPSSHAAGAGIGQPHPKKITKQHSEVNPTKKTSTQFPQRTMSKLQAREPTVTNNNTTADLAKFFRSSPVGAQVDGPNASQRPSTLSHRTVSNNNSANGRNREAVKSGSSIGTTQDSVTASQVTQSSSNSRTGLLDSSNRAPPAHASSNSRPNNKQLPRSNDPPKPPRSQRRVQDPYAIDSDNENEDGDGTPQAPATHGEESLSDFLRNYTPSPPSTAPRPAPPALNGAPKTTKQFSSSMRERISRNIAGVPDHRSPPPKAPKNTAASKSPPQANGGRKSVQRTDSGTSFQPPNQNNINRGRSLEKAPQLPPINPRVTSPQLTSQNGNRSDANRPSQPTRAKPIDRGPRKQLQAREEHGGGPQSGSMGDLAEFLRDTEPPAPSGLVGRARVASPVKEKEESTFGRMFGRKKRT